MGSPVRSVPFSPYHATPDYSNFQIGNTPRYDCPYRRIMTSEKPSQESTPRGFTAKVQPYFANSKASVSRGMMGHGPGDFAPLTPQADPLRKRADSSSEVIDKYYTPQLLSRHISHEAVVYGKDVVYPGRALASPVSKKLKRQDSDSILTEDSITFVKTEL